MILILGSSGKVGRELLPLLIETGAAVRAAYRSRPPLIDGCELVQVDAVTGDGIDAALEGVTDLFLLMGHMANQTEVELGIVERAQAAGVGRIVKLSCLDAPSMAYSFARIHRPVEEAIEQSGLAYTFLRPENFMQNFLTDYADMVRGGTLYLPCGDARTCPIDARDIARVGAAVLGTREHDGKGYDLTGPEALTFSSICETLGEAIGKTLAFETIPEAAFAEAMKAEGVSAEDIEIFLDLYRYIDAGQTSRATDWVERITAQSATTFAEFATAHKSVWMA